LGENVPTEEEGDPLRDASSMEDTSLAGVAPLAGVVPPEEIDPPVGHERPNQTPLFFKFAKATLSSEAKQELIKQLDNFKTAKSILVRGHHDATGPLAFNKVLSRQRAEAVANFLISEGVAPEKIQIETKAAFYFSPNTTREERQQNRRVTVEALQ